MPTKQTVSRWASIKFTSDEMSLIQCTWLQLVDERKVKVDQKLETTNNFHTLCSRLQLVNNKFKKEMEAGLPSESKKYK